MSDERHGTSWVLDDYCFLVERIREGDDDEALVAAVGRSLASLRTTARRLLPREGGKRRSNLASLREMLEDEAYPWEEHLRATYKAEGKTLWSREIDATLRKAWASGSPSLPEVAADLGLDEEDVARRMVERGIAPTTVEIARRLGCTEGGEVDLRARIAMDDWTTSVTTLLVFSPEATLLYAVSLGASLREEMEREMGEQAAAHPGAKWVKVTRALGADEGEDEDGFFPAAPAQADPGDPWAV